MTNEPQRSQRPRQDLGELTQEMVKAWQAMAAASAEIASARRTLFLSYVAEGFSEAQALELIKNI